MRKKMKKLIILFMAFFLAGCALPQQKPMTFEEQQACAARQQCEEEATNMAGPNTWQSNPYWNDYFVMCMNRLGVSDAQLKKMWY